MFRLDYRATYINVSYKVYGIKWNIDKMISGLFMMHIILVSKPLIIVSAIYELQ